jgi:uncharacterized protein YjbJ (UPF0337 family)
MTMGDSGPREGIDSVIEGVKGKAKEAVGAIKGDESLKREGEAQQDKAAAKREAAVKEAEADKARAKAKAHDAEEAAQQRR